MSDNRGSTSEKKKEDWMNTKWRPMMGWMYMAVCVCDFMLFPVLWALIQQMMRTGPLMQWQPLTLQGAGLFHIAMGAVLGIAAYGRTKEKMAGAEMGGLGEGFGASAGTTYVPPNSMGMVNVTSNNTAPTNFGSNNSFNNSSSSSTFSNQQAFGSSNTGFNSGASSFSAPAPSFGGTTNPPTFSSTPPAFGGKPTGPTQSFPPL
jgi:hypothetical protein